MILTNNKASYDLSCKNVLHCSLFIIHYSLQAKRSDYFEARYMANDLGRFISPDLALPSLTATQSFNRYVYCKNNPMKYVDINGEFPIKSKYHRLETSTEEIGEITMQSMTGFTHGIWDTLADWNKTAYEIWDETQDAFWAPTFVCHLEVRDELSFGMDNAIFNLAQTAYDLEYGNINVDAYEFGYKVGKELMKTEIKLAPLALLEGYVNYKIGNSSLMKGRTTDWKKLKVSRVKESKHVLLQLEDTAIKGEVKKHVLGLHKPDKVKGLHLVGRTMEGEEITYFDIFKKE